MYPFLFWCLFCGEGSLLRICPSQNELSSHVYMFVHDSVGMVNALFKIVMCEHSESPMLVSQARSTMTIIDVLVTDQG